MKSAALIFALSMLASCVGESDEFPVTGTPTVVAGNPGGSSPGMPVVDAGFFDAGSNGSAVDGSVFGDAPPGVDSGF